LRRATAVAVLLSFLILYLTGAAFLWVRRAQIAGLFRLGLDLRGGVRVVLQAEGTPEAPVTDQSLQEAENIIRVRVDRLGVTEPIVQREPELGRIVVELPGVEERHAALDLIGRTGLLEFYDEEGNLIITGRDLVRADAAFQPGTNEPVVTLDLVPEARKKFAEATTRNVGRRIIIMLDGQIISAPVVSVGGIEEPIITGYPSMEEAFRLSVLLNSGILPLNLRVVEDYAVSATLGQDSLEKSKQAVLIGLAAVGLFMLSVYRLPGLMADLALGVYMVLLLGALLAVRATITLHAIAGIVLSVGMAVDANVIIFERIKEELRAGFTIAASLDRGFRRAMRAILDANVTTLIAAAALFRYGTGPVRGFALTLSIGIIASMITAILLTRFLLKFLVGTRLLADAPRYFGVRS